MNFFLFLSTPLLFLLYNETPTFKKKKHRNFFFCMRWFNAFIQWLFHRHQWFLTGTGAIPADIGERWKYTPDISEVRHRTHTHTLYWGVRVCLGGNWKTWRKPHTEKWTTCRPHIKRPQLKPGSHVRRFLGPTPAFVQVSAMRDSKVSWC